MASPTTALKLVEEDCVVDRDIQKYLAQRVRLLTRDETSVEESLIGKCVARSKADARVVASADDYDSLEDVLADKKIDPHSVVMSYVDNPDGDAIHWSP